MIIIRYLAPTDLRAHLSRALPGATDTDFAALTILIQAGRFLTDSGRPHPAFVNWVAGILDRGGDAAPVLAIGPAPQPVPGGLAVAL